MNAKDAADAGKSATLTLGSNQQTHLPVRSGTIGPDVIDVGRLYRDTGCFTYDPGFTSTANCSSQHHLHRRRQGRAALSRLSDRAAAPRIELRRGLLPAAATASCRPRPQFENFRNTITRHTMVHEQMTRFFTGFRRDAHPMAIMCGSVGALSAFYHDSTDINDPQQRMIASHRLIAKMPTLAAMAYKYSIGQPFIYPRNDLDYTSNFLQMCFAVPCEPYVVNPIVVARARPHPDPARRPRAERLHLHRAARRLLRRQPVRLHRRRHRLPVGPRARRRQRGRAQDAGGDRHRRPRARVRQEGQGQELRASA